MKCVRLINHRRFLSLISSLKREKNKRGEGKRRLPNNIFKLEKRSRELAQLEGTIENEYKNTLIPLNEWLGSSLLCTLPSHLFFSAAANRETDGFSMEKWRPVDINSKGFAWYRCLLEHWNVRRWFTRFARNYPTNLKSNLINERRLTTNVRSR